MKNKEQWIVYLADCANPSLWVCTSKDAAVAMAEEKSRSMSRPHRIAKVYGEVKEVKPPKYKVVRL